MNSDIETQLGRLAEATDPTLDPIGADELETRRTSRGPSRSGRVALRVAAGIAVLAASGGIAVFHSATSNSPPPTSLPDSFGAVAIEEPLESFDELPWASFSTPDQDRRRRISQATEKLTRECMAELGHDFQTLGFDPTPTRNRYGLVDLAVADTLGYADPDGEGRGDATAGMSKDYIHALVGDQDAGGHQVVVTSPSGQVLATYFRDGCLWEAEQAVWGDWAAYEADRIILQQVDGRARDEALTDRSVVAAMKRWSDCMAEAGYDVVDQDALYSELLPEVREADGGRERAGSAERTLAAADATCNLNAGLERAWYHADVASQRRLLADAEVSASELEAKLSAADSRAREVLAS